MSIESSPIGVVRNARLATSTAPACLATETIVDLGGFSIGIVLAACVLTTRHVEASRVPRILQELGWILKVD